MRRASIAVERPDLLPFWSPKNAESPYDLSAGSHKKVIWLCEKGHEWSATVKNRALIGSGCPYCSCRAVLKGFNDFASVHPELVSEWSDKNSIKPTDVTEYSNKRVWWRCSKGHEWFALISSRSDGHGCPYCAGHQVWVGYNDLNTTHPNLAAEWSIKNTSLSPTSVTSKNRSNVWWHCLNCNNEYMAVIDARAKGLVCPFCTAIENESKRAQRNREKIIEHEYRRQFVKLAVIYYAGRSGLVVKTDDDSLMGMKITAYIAEINLAIDACESEKEIGIKQFILNKKGVSYYTLSKPMSESDTVDKIRQIFINNHIYSNRTIEEDIKYIREKWAVYAQKNIFTSGDC